VQEARHYLVGVIELAPGECRDQGMRGPDLDVGQGSVAGFLPATHVQEDPCAEGHGRAEISPTSFVNHYDWGEFGGNPHDLMDELFDAHLYFANWGTRVLYLRFPLALIDVDVYQDYCGGECVWLRTTATHVVFAIERYGEPPAIDVDDGTQWLASLVQLREAILEGDLRCLYLAWLLAVQRGEVDEQDVEPPVPPGLGDLTEPLRDLVEFMQIAESLVEAAAAASVGEVPGLPRADETAEMVAAMSGGDKERWLIRLLSEHNPHLGRELRRALKGPEQQTDLPPGEAKARRTASELMDRVVRPPRRRRKLRF